MLTHLQAHAYIWCVLEQAGTGLDCLRTPAQPASRLLGATDGSLLATTSELPAGQMMSASRAPAAQATAPASHSQGGTIQYPANSQSISQPERGATPFQARPYLDKTGHGKAAITAGSQYIANERAGNAHTMADARLAALTHTTPVPEAQLLAGATISPLVAHTIGAGFANLDGTASLEPTVQKPRDGSIGRSGQGSLSPAFKPRQPNG
ncbi:hypothetical protein WJX84_009210 [Apatococcus fuscideae]|uniref:Uncharacterized protein n=1 Tax=Apatococcus fuscideae TaxID=2026836 RepID=A0AAW1TI57_9CHLO